MRGTLLLGWFLANLVGSSLSLSLSLLLGALQSVTFTFLCFDQGSVYANLVRLTWEMIFSNESDSNTGGKIDSASCEFVGLGSETEIVIVPMGYYRTSA